MSQPVDAEIACGSVALEEIIGVLPDDNRTLILVRPWSPLVHRPGSGLVRRHADPGHTADFGARP